MRKLFVFLGLLLIPLFVVTPVLAQSASETVILGKDEIIDRDYFAAGESVTVLGTINGDAYVAGGNVLIEGTVNGDLLVAGGSVTVRGIVAQDIRAAGGNVTIASNTGGNITVAGGNIVLLEGAEIEGSLVAAGGSINQDAELGRGATIGGGQVILSNTINGDVWAGVGNLTLSPNARVNGNLHYVSDTELTVHEGASISGETTRETPPGPSEKERREAKGALAGAFAGFRFINLISYLLLGLLFIRLVPNLMKKASNNVSSNTLLAFGLGALTYLLFPFVFIILLITIVGIPLAFILLALVLILAYVSKIFVALWLGRWILRKLNRSENLYGGLIVGLIAYFILGFIPLVNVLAFLGFMLVGTGALLLMKQSVYKDLKKEKSM